jgi:hypothetical protein
MPKSNKLCDKIRYGKQKWTNPRLNNWRSSFGMYDLQKKKQSLHCFDYRYYNWDDSQLLTLDPF